jgi:hypothetical protein
MAATSPARTTKPSMTTPPLSAITDSTWLVQELPNELQVRILSYLRAHDLSKVHQVNRYMAQAHQLHHDIVLYCAEQVYPPKWTRGFQYQPTTSTPTLVDPNGRCPTNGGIGMKSPSGLRTPTGTTGSSFGSSDDETIQLRATKSRSSSLGSLTDNITMRSPPNPNARNVVTEIQVPTHQDELPDPVYYTFEHLRNMELLVVARVLNSPEPSTGYVVSKSWCKTALCWLEGQQQQGRAYEQQQQHGGTSEHSKKKKAKKLKTKSTKKLATQRAATPPPNINSDITCAHNHLQHYTSMKSARARRRLLDKQAWKILKALYPESTPLPTQSGECIQCIAESCQIQKLEQDQQDAWKEQRKLPLQNSNIRRFYTRTRGVPEFCLRTRCRTTGTATTMTIDHKQDNDNCGNSSCPLIDGTYYVLPRAWCHGWRRFIKTGEGGSNSSSCNSNMVTSYSPPDASCLLCDAHRLALLPPHLEAYLYGESGHLFDSLGGPRMHSDSNAHPPEMLPPGQGPTEESILAMRSLGLNENEIGMQLSAIRLIEARNERLRRIEDDATAVTRNELLDQENYNVVEILTETEFRALIACWSATTSVYVLSFVVKNGTVISIAAVTERESSIGCGPEDASCSDFSISVCRSCDATGRYQCFKGKQRCSRGGNGGGNKKSNHEKSRATTSLEY